MFDAAEEVLHRDGVAGLTSRAVTTQAGVAKGVMHRHFADFDAFLAELILDRVARLKATARLLGDRAGTGEVAENLAEALASVFTPLGLAVVALVVTRDGLRARLRDAGAARLPLLVEGTEMVIAYLTEEQASGRMDATADIAMLGPALVGTAHLLLTDRDNETSDAENLHRVLATVVEGMLAGKLRRPDRRIRP